MFAEILFTRLVAPAIAIFVVRVVVITAVVARVEDLVAGTKMVVAVVAAVVVLVRTAVVARVVAGVVVVMPTTVVVRV